MPNNKTIKIIIILNGIDEVISCVVKLKEGISYDIFVSEELELFIDGNDDVDITDGSLFFDLNEFVMVSNIFPMGFNVFEDILL